ncbi:DUF6463 family protein [Nocardia sp. NPDC051832]|uniref:DUF6463 family protein n=1 Tax=Nocardia sp. NPDC051832 TaxID=3155673 RepID=UPI003420E172
MTTFGPQGRNEAPPSNPAATRWVPRLLLAAAALHWVFMVTDGIWIELAKAGLWNTVTPDDHARMATLWFGLAGIAYLGLGLIARNAAATTGRIPAEISWTLVAVGAPMAVIMPASGGWLLLALGLYALLRQR